MLLGVRKIIHICVVWFKEDIRHSCVVLCEEDKILVCCLVQEYMTPLCWLV